MIMVFVMWMLFRCINLYAYNPSTDPKHANVPGGKSAVVPIHNTFLEIVWTITPAFILVFIAVPSFALLYAMEELIEPSLTIKIMGHQWYWVYEYSNCTLPNLSEHVDDRKFESYMIPTDDLYQGQLRLLEVDNRLFVSIKTHLRILVSAADVLHCWAVPSLGVKVDACPGRINQASIFIKRDGVFYGQCSEICGVNHGFMPIVVQSLPVEDWMKKMYITNILNIIEENPDFQLEGFENISKLN
jgi:cytochrome c oxidase subunit 2